jgi:hypothetical protein
MPGNGKPERQMGDAALLDRQGGRLDQPGGGVLDEHDVLVGDVFLFEDPAELAEEVLGLVDLRGVEHHRRMAVHDRLCRAGRKPGAVKVRMAFGCGFGIAAEAGMKEAFQQPPLRYGEDLMAFGKKRQEDRETINVAA